MAVRPLPAPGVDPAPATPAPKRRWPSRRQLLRVALALLALAALGLGARFVMHRLAYLTVDDAHIEADMVDVSSRVGGWLTRLAVEEGDEVFAGQILATIDSRGIALAQEQLTAERAALDAEHAAALAERERLQRHLEAGITQAQARLEVAEAAATAAKAALATARRDLTRAETLDVDGMIARQRVDAARQRVVDRQQADRARRAEITLARTALADARQERRQLDVLAERIAALAAQRQAKQASLAQLRVDLADHAVRSPVGGIVDERFVAAGEYVQPGQRLLLVHDPQAIWVEARIKETELRHLQAGAPVTVRVDAWPGEAFSGRVLRIGHAATGEFALIPAPNPSGNFTKITQRVPVQVALGQHEGRLRPGMMAVLTIPKQTAPARAGEAAAPTS